MGLRANDLLEFPTCGTIIEPPISGDDCTNFATFEALVDNEQHDGDGATIRSGMAFAIRAIGDIQTDCEAV
jgi:hypothetical protein